jgi:hypothetical protein
MGKLSRVRPGACHPVVSHSRQGAQRCCALRSTLASVGIKRKGVWSGACLAREAVRSSCKGQYGTENRLFLKCPEVLSRPAKRASVEDQSNRFARGSVGETAYL